MTRGEITREMIGHVTLNVIRPKGVIERIFYSSEKKKKRNSGITWKDLIKQVKRHGYV